MNYWLVKSEPNTYNWGQFVKDKKTTWDGVRNYAARNNLKAMKKGDQVLFYHSNEGLAIAGIAEVVKEAYQDPTTEDTNWVVVDLKRGITFYQCRTSIIARTPCKKMREPVKVRPGDRIELTFKYVGKVPSVHIFAVKATEKMVEHSGVVGDIHTTGPIANIPGIPEQKYAFTVKEGVMDYATHCNIQCLGMNVK